MNNCFIISEGAFTFKVEGTGVVTRGFFVSGGSEVTTIITSQPPLTKNPLVITFSFIWNYLLCILIYHYFTLISLDFELHGY